MEKSNKNMRNRNWLVYANENICRHYDALSILKFINWKRDDRRYKMRKGDIVYIFSSKERKIIFKTIVATYEERKDSDFWILPAPKDVTWRLDVVKEYIGSGLDESIMRLHGFKGGRSIETPMCNNPELFAYIESKFEELVDLDGLRVTAEELGAIVRNNQG